MDNSIFPHAKWICTEQFSGENPIDVLEIQKSGGQVEMPEEMKNQRILINKSFFFKQSGKSVRIRITADDYYKLYINGRFVGQGPAQGYYFCYYWNEFDITDFLNNGENEISVDVYYHGLISRSYNSADRRMGMVAELYSEDKCILFTDETWQYSRLKLWEGNCEFVGAQTQFLENIDSRIPTGASRQCCTKLTDYTFSAELVKPLSVCQKLPVNVKMLKSGGMVYDFGEEITAALSICAEGNASDHVLIFCGEEIDNSDIGIKYNMRCNCRYEEEWILKDGQNHYDQYDYKGFRYVAVIPNDGVKNLFIKANVRHYPFDNDYCKLETDNKTLRDIWSICKNTVRCGSQEVFVDCPTREKGQYAGDLTITSAAHIVLTGDTSLLKKSIDNQMQSSHFTKSLLAVTPGSLWQEIADYSFQFPILALRYYKLSADRGYLSENLKICEGIIEHFRQYAREDGILQNITDKWNLVDWPPESRDDYDFPLDPLGSGSHNVINAFYIGCVLGTEEIREILGISREKESKKLIAAFNREFLNPETGLYTDSSSSAHSSLHANVLPAYYGFLPTESRNAIGDLIVKKGLCCSVYMSYFTLKALCGLGKYEEAYSLIVSTGERSWYNMLNEGATTCFEAWGKDQKWNTSLCHPWASAPISLLAEDILPNLPNVGRLIYKGDELSGN
ncbi:MAG: alpha-L-rhamnosidase N-terminal domain-containing protein [Oscillospiraceae bacterium]|nr:alpha-L-rhamnosidase N-terminal domain-containing protein [Oscillospiraceae bacterium]